MKELEISYMLMVLSKLEQKSLGSVLIQESKSSMTNASILVVNPATSYIMMKKKLNSPICAPSITPPPPHASSYT